MKELPILFNGEMVRAILQGQKTQTRRVVKPQPNRVDAVHVDGSITTNLIFRKGDQRIHCQYGKPGDRLWVRETWATSYKYNQLSPKHIPRTEEGTIGGISTAIHYMADGRASDGYIIPDLGVVRPSIHMPRWASRIFLEITSIRVERLREISESDAWAEGIHFRARGITRYEGESIHLFQGLWDSLHVGEEDYLWDRNPWVWVIEFRRVS